MRIRRRPPLPLSPPQTPNFSPNTTTREEKEKRGLHQDGDLSAAPLHGWRSTDSTPAPSDLHPQQVFKEGKDSPSSSSHKKTLDAPVHNNERINGEETMERSNAKVSNIALSNSIIINVGGAKEQEALNNNGKIKRRAPAVLMEGSRCSRVNGRGWRCSQQTLIGYSLCEHHLGKGRLRSISSVRVKRSNNVSTGKPRKKEVKIGVVKARSMSSLLDEEEDDGDGHDQSVDAMATAESKMALV